MFGASPSSLYSFALLPLCASAGCITSAMLSKVGITALIDGLRSSRDWRAGPACVASVAMSRFICWALHVDGQISWNVAAIECAIATNPTNVGSTGVTALTWQLLSMMACAAIAAPLVGTSTFAVMPVAGGGMLFSLTTGI